MAWTSLTTRLSSLPLVIAGPIVRKVTANSVSVWIALKEAESLQLVIKSTPGADPISSATFSTMAFGAHLHVALITVSGLSLSPNTLYFYDINFSRSRTLSSPGILESAGGVSKIVYRDQLLPSFMLPSNDMRQLKIVHCSCRKPHGGVSGDTGNDAFEAVSILLEGTHNIPEHRPQQLYLTGDQIYADDVSDLLLYMIQDAENALLMGTSGEELPTNPNTLYPMNIHLRPLHRSALITDAGFTSGDVAKSHLVKLGEFYGMYLFVWSDVLWPADNLNFPAYPEYLEYALDTDPFFNLRGEYSLDKYNDKKEKLTGFKDKLPYVRKILANISTYMIFDDHEITDDWFLNRSWTEKVYASENGTRIIQNGLSAYAVFQGWGNKPESFIDTATDENRLISALVTLNQHGLSSTSQIADWDAIKQLVIPTITSGNLTGGIDWSYSLSFEKFNVIVVNARTNRALFRNYSGLLSNAAMQTQITDRVSEKLTSHEFTLLIAPCPVFGLRFMEEFIQPTVSRIWDTAAGDYEPWSADRNKFEHFLKEISAFSRVLLLSGDVHYAFSNAMDYWDNRSGSELRSKFVNLTSSSLRNSTSATTFLANMINNRIPDIILRIENNGLYVCWNTPNLPGSPYISTEESQLGLGSLIPIRGGISVNRGSGPGIAHWHHLVPYSITSYHEMGGHSTSVSTQMVNPSFPPDWEYKITFECDFRTESERRAGTMPTLSSTTGAIATAGRHSALSRGRGNHTVVGHNNIGEITFQWGTSETDKKVTHTIWSKVDSNFLPFTIHLVDFGIASAADPKPSEIGRTP